MVRVNMILAMDKNGLIGVGDRLPWHNSCDLKRFRSLTMGRPVVMGRKTFQSIGNPLEGRTNYILSRHFKSGVYLGLEGTYECSGLRNLFTYLETLGTPEVFVIGGGEIFRQVEPICERLFLTLIHQPGEAVGELHHYSLGEGWVPESVEEGDGCTFINFRRLDHA